MNAHLVGPEDAEQLLATLADLPRWRPGTVLVEAGGRLEETVARVEAVLSSR